MSDIATLFATDPLHLTEPDLDKIIAHMRASRHQFNAGARPAKATKPKSEKQKLAAQLDLKGIDL